MRAFAPALLACLLSIGCQPSHELAESPSTLSFMAQECEVQGQQTLVRFTTNQGHFTIALYPSESPITVDNFTYYVQEQFFNNTLFHQVIDSFVLQAGIYDTDFNQKEPLLPAIVNESYNHALNRRGTVAMMRYNHPDSATSEFMINLSDNTLLDMPNGYAVFGQVIDGMDTIDAIAKVKVCSGGSFELDVPCEKVIIQSATLETQACPS